MAPFVLTRYIFQDGRIGTSTSYGGRSFLSKDYVCLFTATELDLRSGIALFETTGNLETCTLLRRL